MIRYLFIILFAMSFFQASANTNINEVMKLYSQNGSLSMDAERGKKLWEKKNVGKNGKNRECSTCHGSDLNKAGKHVKSGKVIDPMALSVNKERYTDLKKVKKWFKRNCKWTYGRECTDQEKVDLLKYLSQF